MAWAITIVMSSLQLFFTLVGMGRWSWEFIPYYWSVMIFATLGIQVNVVGIEKLAGPAIFVMNHQSLVDVVLVPRILPRKILYVVKKELEKIPFFGPAVCSTGAIAVNRRDPVAAISSINEGLARLSHQCSVMVFPEGTRTSDGEVKDFKKGFLHIARASGLPVIPVGISGAMDCCGYQELVPRPGLIECTVGDPIKMCADEDMEMAIARVRDRVCDLETQSRRRHSFGRRSREAHQLKRV